MERRPQPITLGTKNPARRRAAVRPGPLLVVIAVTASVLLIDAGLVVTGRTTPTAAGLAGQAAGSPSVTMPRAGAGSVESGAALAAPAGTWTLDAPGSRSQDTGGCLVAAASAQPTETEAKEPTARPTKQTTPSTLISTHTTRPVAAFLGDSYTSGFNGAGYGRSGWPAIVSAALGLRSLNRAVPGTGFVNPGWTAQPISTRVAAVIRANPRIVFLAGGHNDRRYPTSATRSAAIAVIDRIHRALPEARLVVIGPLWSGDVAPASLRHLRDTERREAIAVGASFIDPIAGGWLAGASKRYIGSDGLHPTNAGHRHIAALVLRALSHEARTTASPAPSIVAASGADPSPAADVTMSEPRAGRCVA